MNELAHLIFRWLHVLAAVMWIGQIWSLAIVLRLTPDRSTDPGLAPCLLRAHNWLRWSANLTWITGIPLLGIVYYGGGALTTPGQSPGLAMGIGFGALFAGWFVYDALWRLLGRQPLLAGVVSLALLASATVWMSRVMTGRAVFIHLGAMLGTIMMVNVQQRIWPVERRRLASATGKQPSPAMVDLAAQRLRHNAALAVAVILFMVSNHFPLVYGNARAWLLPPVIVTLGWIMSRLLSGRGPSRELQHT